MPWKNLAQGLVTPMSPAAEVACQPVGTPRRLSGILGSDLPWARAR